MTQKDLLKKFKEYDKEKPKIVTEISGLLGIPINGSLTVEVPNRNGFVYVRLRNNTNELIQAFNEKVSTVYGLPVLVKWNVNRYEVEGRDTNRYQDWGSYSAFLPRHGSQHSLNFEAGQGGDVSFIYSRQFVPFSAIPSGTKGAGTVFIEPYTFRNPSDGSWVYIGDTSSENFLPAKPTGSEARMMLLYWNLSTNTPLIATGTFLSAALTGTSSVITAIPAVTSPQHIPIAGIRLVSGTKSLLWDNIYDLRQFSVTTPASFGGGVGVWDEGVPQGTGTIFNFVGAGVTASISGSVVNVEVSAGGGGGSSVDTLGFAGLDEGVPIGTGTFLNVRGERAVISRSGTMFALDISPDPQELIGIFGQDEGIDLGTGTILNITGDNIVMSLSGTVLNIHHQNPTFPQELIGIMGWNQGVPLGTGTVLNINGTRLVGSLSGTVLNLSNSPDPQDNIGIFALDDGSTVGTGTILNFGNNLSAVRTGTTIFIDAVAGGGGGAGNVTVYDDSSFVATGTKISFNQNLTVEATGTSVFVTAPITTYFRVGQPSPLTSITGLYWSVPDRVYASGSLGVFNDGHVLVPGIDYEEQLWVSGTYRYLSTPVTGTVHMVHYGVPCSPQTQPPTGTPISDNQLTDSNGVLMVDSNGIQLVDSNG